MVRGQWVWTGIFMALTACGGRTVSDGATASGGASSGGTSSTGGTSSGGTSSSSGATATSCLNSGETQPASPVTFSFESNQGMWIRQSCAIDYALSKSCKDTSIAIQTQIFCSQECGSGDNGCVECGACPDGALQLGQFGPKGPNVATDWDGYVYTSGVSNSGCGCYTRTPARSGTYVIAVTGFLTSDDAQSQKNGYPFTTTFQYPPPNGIVDVKLDFQGL